MRSTKLPFCLEPAMSSPRLPSQHRQNDDAKIFETAGHRCHVGIPPFLRGQYLKAFLRHGHGRQEPPASQKEAKAPLVAEASDPAVPAPGTFVDIFTTF